MSSTTETPGTWFSLRPNGQAIICAQLSVPVSASGSAARSRGRSKQARDSNAGDAEADAKRHKQPKRRQRPAEIQRGTGGVWYARTTCPSGRWGRWRRSAPASCTARCPSGNPPHPRGTRRANPGARQPSLVRALQSDTMTTAQSGCVGETRKPETEDKRRCLRRKAAQRKRVLAAAVKRASPKRRPRVENVGTLCHSRSLG